MSSDEIVIIDSEDETPVNKSNENKSVEEVVLTDSSDSDVLIETQIIKSDIEFIGRGYRSIFRSKRRKDRNKNRKNGSNNDINCEHLLSSDSNQSRPNSSLQTIGLKDELITPPKNPPNNQLFKSSPNFDAHNQSLSQPLVQTSNETQSSSQVLDPIPPEIPNQSSVISSTLPSFPVDPPLALPSDDLSSISPIEEPFGGTEANDFGIEDVDQQNDTNAGNDSEADLLRSPNHLERSSTPISTTDVIHSEVISQNHSSIDSSLNEQINETLNNNVGQTSIDTEINESIESNTESVLKEDQNLTKEIGVGTEEELKILNLDENQTIEAMAPVGEYYICSFGCGEEFNNALLHYKHEKKHSNELLRRRIPTFKCRFTNCPFMGLTQVDLIYHNTEHQGIFLCHMSECKFRANSAKAVTLHMKKHDIKRRRAYGRKGLIMCDCSELCCLPSEDL